MKRFMDRAIDICRLVPQLPVVVLSAIFVALLWNTRPWGDHFIWYINPSLGQWIVILLVIYTVIDTLKGMIDDIRHGHVGVDILAVVAILSTLAVQEYWASWVVVLMIYSGAAIEAYAQAKAERNLTALLDAAPQTAHVAQLPGVGRNASNANNANSNANTSHSQQSHIEHYAAIDNTSAQTDANADTDGGSVSEHEKTIARQAERTPFTTVPVAQVQLGDVIIVLPGETVPVDGKLLSGSATLDLSNINGEPVPREVYAGARVMSGAINGSSTLTMRATELARDSQYQRIIELVNSAQNSRAAVVKTADLLAVPFTVLSFVIACAAWIISGVPERFAQVLVLATPCPLLIAAPVAYIAGTGRLAKLGILIKAQDVLENLGRVSHVFFDKTGTLTVKKPQVVRVEAVQQQIQQNSDQTQSQARPAQQLDTDHILMYAGVIESYSVHILAKGITTAGNAIIQGLRKAVSQAGVVASGEDAWLGDEHAYPVVKNVVEDAGRGVSGEVNGHTIRVGRFAFVTQSEQDQSEQSTAKSSPASPEQSNNQPASGRQHSADGFRKTASPVSAASSATTNAPDNSQTTPIGKEYFGELAPDEMATYVAVDGVLAARIVLKDVPRSNAKAALEQLHKLGVQRLTMVTGDKLASAQIIADEVGITDIHASLFPEGKVQVIHDASAAQPETTPWWDKLIAKFTGEPITRSITMMVGDGVNDAPVLAAADIGMAMTDGTSTAASESAQVVIMNDDIAAVPRAIAVSRRTKRIMLQAVCIGLGLATIGMIAAAFNIIPVVIGAFMQEAIDVVSILWALTAVLDRD